MILGGIQQKCQCNSVHPIPLLIVPPTSTTSVSVLKWTRTFNWLQKFLHLPGVLQPWINLGLSQIPMELNSRLAQNKRTGFKTGLNSPNLVKPFLLCFLKASGENHKIVRKKNAKIIVVQPVVHYGKHQFNSIVLKVQMLLQSTELVSSLC